MTMRRGKLVWEEAALSAICDLCRRHRNQGDHSACSAQRKRARERETVAAVKRELLEMMQDQNQKPEATHEN